MPTDRTRVDEPAEDKQPERLVFGLHQRCTGCKGKGEKFDGATKRICYRCSGRGYVSNQNYKDDPKEP